MNNILIETFTWIYDQEFDNLISFSKEVEINIESKVEFLDRKMLSFSPESQLTLESKYVIDSYFNMEVYPQIHRKSLFITSYSIFESSLVSICNLLGRELNIPIPLKEISGSAFEKVKKFLTYFSKIKFPDDKNEWATIKDLIHIRNCIVHNNGSISEYKASNNLIDIIQRTKYVYNQNNEIYFESNFIKFTTDIFRTILDSLVLRIMEKYLVESKFTE